MKTNWGDPFKVRKNRYEPRKKKASLASPPQPVGNVIPISDSQLWRLKGIGGSDAPAVMKLSPWCDPEKLLKLKAKLIEPDPPTYPMLRGIRLEPKARRLYEKMAGIKMPADRFIHPQHDFIRVNVDGINLEIGRALEIKCPGKEDHAIAVGGNVPDHYVYQLVHTLMILFQRYGIDDMHYFSYYGKEGEHSVTVPFERDRRLEKKLFPKEVEFWERKLELEGKIKMDQSNKGQRKPANGVAFTKSEAVEILQIAREIGCVRLKLPGFEADFAPQGIQGELPRVDTQSNRVRLPNCEYCGGEKILGTYGIYCRPCYIEKKENDKRRR